MGSSAIDPQDIVRKLKEPGRGLAWMPLDPDPLIHSSAEQIHDRAPIEYLHANWAPEDAFDPAGVGRGIRGHAVARFGRMTYRVLGPYFRHQREVVAHLVQANEALEKRCDDLVRRQHQLEQAVIARQVAEARNLADLAAVLDAGMSDESGPAPDRDTFQRGSTDTSP